MMNAQEKKLYIKTWGCQMNVYDSNRMADVLAPLGYKPVEAPEDADMVILNTCHIREKATDKVFSELGRLRKHQEDKKAKGGKMLMAVAGCVAQAEGDFIMERAPYVDMVFGPQTYHELPQMVMKATGQRVVNTEMPTEAKFDQLPEENKNQGVTAFLAIQEGCDKFCTYCVVPYTRGAEFSRNYEGIRDEAKKLIEAGAREITLLGQNVNGWHGKDLKGRTIGLGDLIAGLADDVDGLERIRYTTSHPNDMKQDLIDAHKDIPKLMPFLHLPVQAGSNKILKAMNRSHTVESYVDIVNEVKKARPDIAMSSDFIVGFPGETEEDFEETLKVVKEVTYAFAYSFIFSQRPGTPAANMGMQIHKAVKSERIQRLQALLNEQQLDFNKAQIGKTMPVLFDRKGSKNGQLHGRTPYNQAIHAEGNERLRGQVVELEVTEARANSLEGKVAII